MRLAKQVAMVTGAGRGLGAGVARALGRAGAAVCASDVNEAELAQTAADLAADGTRSWTTYLDAADDTAVDDVVQAVLARWGRLDIYVHCAAVMPLVPFAASTPESWWQELRVNLGGLLNGARAAWVPMRLQGGGHLISVASGASVRGYENEVIYCASKHALEGVTKALALEMAPHNIAVNTIGPGKRLKPTGVTRAELDALPAANRAGWVDPTVLGEAFVWLVTQPPRRFSGLRFDAGPIVDAIAAEGFNFSFRPEKGTLYVDDFVARQAWHAAQVAS